MLAIQCGIRTNSTPSFLSARQADTPSANLCGVSVLKHIQVRSQSTSIDNLFIPLLIGGSTEKYVIPDGEMLEPRGLCSI